MKDIQNKVTQWAARAAAVFTPNLCLFYSYLYCAGIGFDTEEDALYEAGKMLRRGILGKDGTVLDADALLYAYTGRKARVTKQDITSIDGIREKTPVRYDHNGRSHWVVVENGEIVFNSVENSVCAAKGKPAAARIISWK